jgi:uncharacterized membrane protein SpoIIM required for sporulation
MKVSDLLEARRTNWRQLETLCDQLERRSRRRLPSETILKFSSLYRAACADLALADAYQLPAGTIRYLHRLVGRAHNQLYRSRTFAVSDWARKMLVEVPRRLFFDNSLRLAFGVFWGIFLLSTVVAYRSPGYAERVVGKEQLAMIQQMYSEPPSGRDPSIGGGMAGFYLFHNTSIGLRCFAFGLLFGVGGLYMTVFNAGCLGAVFGFMAGSPQSDNFFHFVTAHGPFELTAIVLSAAAGMRMGFALVDTKGLTRTAALRREAKEALPTMWAAIILFMLAALIEAFVSPSSAPYSAKAMVGGISVGILVFYFLVLGYPRRGS